MMLVRFLLRRSRAVVLLAVLAGVLSGAGSTLLLALINRSLSTESRPGTQLLWIFAGLCTAVLVSRVGSELSLITLAQRAMLTLRLQLGREVLSVPLRRLEKMGSHRVISTLTEDVSVITAVVGLMPGMCINSAIFLGCMSYLAWLSPRVFLVMVAVIVFGILSYQGAILRGVLHMRRARELADDLYRHVQTLTTGAKELKLHRERRELFLTGDLEVTARDYSRSSIKGLRLHSLAGSWGQLLVFVVIGALFFLPAIGGTSMETLRGYTLTLLFLMTPLQVLLDTIPAIGRGNVALKRLQDLGLELRSGSAEQAEAALDFSDRWSCLRLDGVTHAYRRESEEGEFVLGPINLELRPGEVVFVAGGNGSGKTTLAKLLTGLYVPASGAIYLDGKKIDDTNREAYRQQFSAVFYDFHLFSRLVGRTALDGELDAEAATYLSQLQLSHKVRVDGGMLSATDLSQGQRRRLALLSAYLEDRPIYIFDEWAADQDPAFKDIFYREIVPGLRQRGKAVLVVSHDDRYYSLADRVVKLENGQVSVDADLGVLAAESGGVP